MSNTTANFASLGGASLTNASRDLLRSERNKSHLHLDPYYVDVDVWDPYTLGETSRKIPIFLPHELLATVYESGAGDAVFGITDPKAIDTFWHSVRSSTWGKEHPAFELPQLLPWTIPIRVHGDDAVMKSLVNTKLIIVSLHAELCRLPSIKSRLLSFVLKDKQMVITVGHGDRTPKKECFNKESIFRPGPLLGGGQNPAQKCFP